MFEENYLDEAFGDLLGEFFEVRLFRKFASVKIGAKELENKLTTGFGVVWNVVFWRRRRSWWLHRRRLHGDFADDSFLFHVRGNARSIGFARSFLWSFWAREIESIESLESLKTALRSIIFRRTANSFDSFS